MTRSKMHYPQLPDPNGWDIDVTTDTVYDDFLCTQTGPIEDLHFWASWRGDLIGQIACWIDVSLHKDVPANIDLPYSHPDSVMYSDPNTLWFQRFLPGQFTQRPYGTGDQGWLAPSFTQPQWNRPDHQQFFQINIPRIDDPFIQEGQHLLAGHPYRRAGCRHRGRVEDQPRTLQRRRGLLVHHPRPPGPALERTDRPGGRGYGRVIITPEPASLALITLAAMAILLSC
ncbi:MAG: hypothetical protein R3C45_05920 [Phycisphaerales bacterium]